MALTEKQKKELKSISDTIAGVSAACMGGVVLTAITSIIATRYKNTNPSGEVTLNPTNSSTNLQLSTSTVLTTSANVSNDNVNGQEGDVNGSNTDVNANNNNVDANSNNAEALTTETGVTSISGVGMKMN